MEHPLPTRAPRRGLMISFNELPDGRPTMRHLLPIAIAVLAAAPSSPRSAPRQTTTVDPAAPPPAASSGAAKSAAPASHQALAMSRALVPKQTWDRLLDRSAEGLSKAVSRSLASKGSKVPDDLQGSIRRELAQNMKYDSAVDTQAQALQKRFTQQEMESAAKFYASPVGKKVLQQLPDAQSEVGDQLQSQLAMVVPEIIHRVAPDAVNPGGPSDGSAPQDGAPSAGSPAPGENGTGTIP
jgi:hypothetical protein